MDGESVALGVLVSVLILFVCALTGLVAYDAGRDSAVDEAKAAKAGRYSVDAQTGAIDFVWGCEMK